MEKRPEYPASSGLKSTSKRSISFSVRLLENTWQVASQGHGPTLGSQAESLYRNEAVHCCARSLT